MPSHLTRQVFRAIIANEPIIYRGCLARRTYSATYRPGHDGFLRRSRSKSFPVVQRYQQRRTLFGLNLFRPKPPRDSKDVNYEPGIEKMMEYAKMERMSARLPPVEEIVEAWQRFFKMKLVKSVKGVGPQGDRTLQDTQVLLLLQTLRYLKREEKLGNEAAVLDTPTLVKAARMIILKSPTQASQVYVDLAYEIKEALSAPGIQVHDRAKGVDAYLAALCYSGQATKARDLLLLDEGSPDVDDVPSKGNPGVDVKSPRERLFIRWNRVLKGFTREKDEEELLRTLEMMRERNLEQFSELPQTMLRHYLSGKDLPAVEHWWGVLRPYINNARTDGDAGHDAEKLCRRTLRWCLKTGNLQLGHNIIRDMMQGDPTKYVWDTVLLWGSGTKKSVDEIGRMMGVMEKANESIKNPDHRRVPDITTINLLVSHAISQNDPYMAERLIILGQSRNIEPNAKTFALQMDYRLSVGDIDGALIAYKHLQATDQTSDSDVPAVNRLIVALCGSQRHDFDTIMNVAADLSDRSARFDPLTVSTLSILHLSRDELHDVIDLLNTHAYSYSSTERAGIRQALIDFCLNPATLTSRAWDTYTLLRSIFDEMPRSERTDLMLSFFSRHRPDMAVHIFQHMRAHSRADTIPTTSTYISAFLGCAQLKDLESLEVVHNQLKLDYNLDTTTAVRNALILSYTACEMPRRSLDFWDEIVASREGPSVASIHAALRACEKSPFGDLKAREIWARLRRNKIDLSTDLWASYVAALAGNGDNELAIGTLEEAIESGEVSLGSQLVQRDCAKGEEVDRGVLVLGSLYSAASGQVKQAEIEEWAKEQQPEVWARVENVGWEEDENGMRAVKIERRVEP